MTQEWLPLPGTPVEELDTPAIIIDLDAAESNIAKMQQFANEAGISVRPHTKTNKSPYWAWKQLNAGAIGICCAKVGEAEQMADREDIVVDAAGIGEGLLDLAARSGGDKAVQHMRCLVGGCRDLLDVERAEVIGDMGIVFAPGPGAVLGIDEIERLALPGGGEELPVCRRRFSAAP